MLKAVWCFPTLDCGDDFLTDPANLRSEADAMNLLAAAIPSVIASRHVSDILC
jgi:hypothetical protein